MNLYSGDAAIKSGDTYVYKDNKTARLWYKVALDDKFSRNIALRKLVELERKIGNYKTAREYANILLECKDKEANYFFARLEHSECNFLSALDYYSRVLSSKSLSSDFQCVNFKFIANIYTQLGEFEIARRMYETLLYDSISKNIGLLELINLDIIEGNYNHGLILSEQVKSSYQPDFDTLRNYYLILMYNLGRMNEVDKEKFKNSYTYKRLVSNNDSLLLRHIEKHCRVSNLIEIIFNSKNTVDDILKDAPYIMQYSNPVYSEGGLIYRCKFDCSIGKYYDEEVDGLGIVTLNDKIFTMYPLIFSSSFDSEKMTNNEDLKKKRSMGVIK